MIRTQYPEDFIEFWEMFDQVVEAGLGTKGDKKRAFKRYQEKQIGREDFGFLREAITGQVKAKLAKRAAGMFDPDFMQVEGWINNERWDDEISSPVGGLCESDRRRETALRNYLQEDMGKGVDGPTGSETHREGGGSRVVNLRVLEGKLSRTGSD